MNQTIKEEAQSANKEMIVDIARLSVKITGTGENSTVPDDDDAVDADVIYAGVVVGSVTLLPSEWDGDLSTWGSLDHWASASLIKWLDGMVVYDDLGATAESQNRRAEFRDEIAPLVQLEWKATWWTWED
jgi:hypothetical protein